MKTATFVLLPVAAGLALGGCSSSKPTQTAVSEMARGLHLVDSSPKAGATVPGPIDELKLRFSRPARLTEVTVSGPDGLMPAMVDAADETDTYSIPLPDLETGNYEVRWKALAAGAERTGTLRFKVR